MAKRESAFFKAIGEAKQGEQGAESEAAAPSDFSPVPPLNSETVQRLNLPTVQPSHRDTVSPSGRANASAASAASSHRSTVAPSHRETVKPSHSSTVRAELEKTTFYLTQAQLDRLDELAYAYKKQTGKRINRNDIVRFLVDHARLETLLAEW